MLNSNDRVIKHKLGQLNLAGAVIWKPTAQV